MDTNIGQDDLNDVYEQEKHRLVEGCMNYFLMSDIILRRMESRRGVRSPPPFPNLRESLKMCTVNELQEYLLYFKTQHQSIARSEHSSSFFGLRPGFGVIVFQFKKEVSAKPTKKSDPDATPKPPKSEKSKDFGKKCFNLPKKVYNGLKHIFSK